MIWEKKSDYSNDGIISIAGVVLVVAIVSDNNEDNDLALYLVLNRSEYWTAGISGRLFHKNEFLSSLWNMCIRYIIEMIKLGLEKKLPSKVFHCR